MTNSTGFAHIDGEFTVGWSFELASPVTVYALGVFANDFAPLIESHGIAIWRNGTIVAEATVEGGGSPFNTLVEQFRYQPLDTPVTLAAGDYAIGAFYAIMEGKDDDFVVFSAENFVTIPRLTYKKALYTQADGLAEPVTPGVETIAYFAPNFLVTPEPSSLMLGSTAALGLIGFQCVRRRNEGNGGKARD
jgi:hypothetical protein